MYKIAVKPALLIGSLFCCGLWADSTHQQTGTYLDPQNQETVFSFDRTTVIANTKKTVTVVAKDKKLVPALTEVAIYENNRLVSYSSAQHQIGVTAEVAIKRGLSISDKTEISYTTQLGDKTSSATERRSEPVLSNDEIPDFIRSHIDVLRMGQTVSFNLILPLRRESMEFEISLERPRVVSMRSASVLVRVFLDPVKFELDEKQIPGITSILGRTPLNPPSDPGGKDLVLNLKVNEPI